MKIVFALICFLPLKGFADELCANVITSYDSKHNRHSFYVERSSTRMHNPISIIPVTEDVAKQLETKRPSSHYYCFEGTSLLEDFETVGSETWYVRSISEVKPPLRDPEHNS